MMFIEYDKNYNVTGYSSSKPICDDYVELTDTEYDMYKDLLFDKWLFCTIDIKSKKISYDKSKCDEYRESKKYRYNETQLLGQELSGVYISLIKQKTMYGFSREYWKDRLDKKYLNMSQVEELEKMGINLSI